VTTEGLNETEIAEAIRDGNLPSPTHLPECSLFAIRITGTGAAYRSAKDEFVWRDKAFYLNEEFLKRCNGLPAIWLHPEKGLLRSENYHDHIIGGVVLPYIKDDEIWGIARIYDKDAIFLMSPEPEGAGKQYSTSPGVKFAPDSDNRKITLGNGDVLLIEGEPVYLCHIAICEQGVWDKMAEADGVSVTTEEKSMTEEDKAAQEAKDAQARKDAADKEMPSWAADSFGKVMERLDAMGTRMDSMEAKKDGEPTEEEKKAKAEAEAKDAAEKAAKETEEKDAATKARLDAVEEAVKNAKPVERSDEEAKACADAQSECDSVAMAFGKQARSALPGESSTVYRRRLASEYQAHSPRWKEANLAILDGAALNVAVEDIYKDAHVAARAPSTVPAGTLRPIKKSSEAGHRITEWVGDIGAMWAPFQPPTIAQCKFTDIGAMQFGRMSSNQGVN
jgi:hypothetical protein